MRGEHPAVAGDNAVLFVSTRAPIKDRLIGKDHGGNPVFRGTRVPVHRLAELVPSRVRARTRGRRGSVRLYSSVLGIDALTNRTSSADLSLR